MIQWYERVGFRIVRGGVAARGGVSDQPEAFGTAFFHRTPTVIAGPATSAAESAEVTTCTVPEWE